VVIMVPPQHAAGYQNPEAPWNGALRWKAGVGDFPSFCRSPAECPSSLLCGAWQNIAGDGFRQSTATGVPRPREEITPYGRSETVPGHDHSMSRCAHTG
jgi:hypothetical protein